MLRSIFRTQSMFNKEVRTLKEKLLTYERGWPPGHFYSPIPDLDQVKQREQFIWTSNVKEIAGIDLREKEQLVMLSSIAEHYKVQPWQDDKTKDLLYYFQNPNFTYGESIILFGLLMHLRPARVLEIGSGYSSCVFIDTNKNFFEGSMSITLIEPYTDLLYSLIETSDRSALTIYPNKLQDVALEVFKELNEGDILFIDSTHISKIDSDLNYILFSILPALKSGVYIHFHDIYFPFEYPKEWIYQGRAWNEIYLLRAFLQYNTDFELIYFNSMIGMNHKQLLQEKMPLCGKNAGSSLWLRKK